MKIYLYDSLASLPEDEGNHILVFAGRGSLLNPVVTEMVTEVLCTYRVGDTMIEFPRNGDAENQRFEQAFSWSIKYAAAHDIPNVYGVFELNRPLDYQYLKRICPDGIIDKRVRQPSVDDISKGGVLCPACLQDASVALKKTVSAAWHATTSLRGNA